MKCYWTYTLFVQVLNIFLQLAEVYHGWPFFYPFLLKVGTGVENLHLLGSRPLFQEKFWTFENSRAACGEIKGWSEARLSLRYLRLEISIAPYASQSLDHHKDGQHQ